MYSRLVWLIALVGLLASPTAATEVGGGGSRRTDCLLTLDAPVNWPPRRPRHVVCVDGDPSCDADATVNGVCSVAVRACANSTYAPERCTLDSLSSAEVFFALDNGDPRFDPDFQALQGRIDDEIQPPTTTADVCTEVSVMQVPIRGPYRGRCGRGRKLIRTFAVSQPTGGRVYRDRDRMILLCRPDRDTGCDATELFSGTFDRIQRQVFNKSCALSGCHDSQSVAGGMLLEVGAAYGSIVDQDPSNGAARAAGWKRIDAAGQDPDTSFLYQKIAERITSDLGNRMPLGRRRLHRTLRDIIRLWIEAGAPQTGWVAGTEE